MEEKIINMPKVELHLHLDGSVSIDLLEKFSHLSHEEIIQNVVSENDLTLKDYLKHFDFVNKYLQTKENLELASCTLGNELIKENIIYAEIRFAPLDYIKEGLTPNEVVDAVLSGFSKCNLKTNLILCMRRGEDFSYNKKVIDLANKYLNKGVVAVDLVGDEEHFPFKEYESLFKICHYANIPVTIHAGETNKRDILDIIPYTKRIGHGIKIIDDNALIDLIKKNDILLEVCPNSNLDTKNILDYYNHPIKKLLSCGVKVSINTDNRTVSNITLNEEYQNLYHYLNFTHDDFINMNLNAIDKAFISEEEKENLKSIIKKDS